MQANGPRRAPPPAVHSSSLQPSCLPLSRRLPILFSGVLGPLHELGGGLSRPHRPLSRTCCSPALILLAVPAPLGVWCLWRAMWQVIRVGAAWHRRSRLHSTRPPPTDGSKGGPPRGAATSTSRHRTLPSRSFVGIRGSPCKRNYIIPFTCIS